MIIYRAVVNYLETSSFIDLEKKEKFFVKELDALNYIWGMYLTTYKAEDNEKEWLDLITNKSINDIMYVEKIEVEE